VGLSIIKTFEVAKAEEQKYIDKFKNLDKFFWNLKVDGQRLIALGNVHGEYLFMSSSGKDMSQLYYTSLGEDIKSMFKTYFRHSENKSACFDGELLGVDGSGKELERRKSNGICTKMQNMNASKEETDSMRFWCFDLIGYDTPDLKYEGTQKPLLERIAELELVKQDSFVPTDRIIFLPYHEVSSIKELMNQFSHLIKDGFEGIIAKKADSPYEIKRQQHWVKLKREVEIDVVVTGWTPHKKRDDMIGSLLIESACGKIKGAIGTGEWLTEKKRLELHTRASSGSLHGTILEIVIHEITKNKKNDELSFYLPRISRERDDKEVADDYEKIMSMF
jgi:ATP-dependent DNA ligase